jgi:hypothetical protein
MEEAEYRKLAAVEDGMWYFRGLHALIERALAAAMAGRPGAVLDAGCGAGGLSGTRIGPGPGWIPPPWLVRSPASGRGAGPCSRLR